MFKINSKTERLQNIIEKNKARRYLKAVPELTSQAKRRRVNFYVYYHGLLNIHCDDLTEKRDWTMGHYNF